MKQMLFPVVTLAVIISSCNLVGGERIRGNGNMKVENRNISPFDAVSVSGNWRITFEFRDGNAYILDYEDYH